MPISNFFRITRLQGALLGSFFLHAALFYGFSRFLGTAQVFNVPRRVVLEVQLIPSMPDIVLQTPVPLESTSTIAETPKEPLTPLPETPKELVSQTPKGLPIATWELQEPKVKNFPDLEYPLNTANITATLEIEVSLDKEGKATAVKIINESPTAMFTEWAWELGMKGSYTPKITINGPIASILTIRLDISPGMPIDVH